MTHYIITGATGFIGKAFVEKLVKDKEKVTIIVRNRIKAQDLFGDSVIIVEQDLNDINSMYLEPPKEDERRILVHFAWDGTSGDKRAREVTQLNNVRLSCDLLRKAKEWQVDRFVNAGSIMEYEAIKTVLYDGQRPNRNSVYSIAKLTTNFLLKTIAADINPNYVNVIISNVYGPGERTPRFLNSVIRALINNQDLDLTEGKQLYDFIYIDDAMQMIKMVAEKAKNFESYYIGNTMQYPLREFVIKAKEIIKSNSKLNFGAVPFMGQALNYTEFDTSKVFNLEGVEIKISFEEGIKKVVEGYLDEKTVI